jgi:hypothetical protein
VDPAVTKMVSYFNVSAEMLSLASAEAIKESFRQEKKSNTKDMIRSPGSFIGIKNKATIPQSRKEHKGKSIRYLVLFMP